MQIVSSGDNLHEMSEPIFWEKKIRKNIINLSSAELAQCVVKVKSLFIYQKSIMSIS